MLYKRILGTFFVLLFSFQLAPVQQVGSFLYSNQMTEEIPHNPDEGNTKYPEDSLKLYFVSHDHRHDEMLPGTLFKGMAVDVQVISRWLDDIQTPPPNHLS